MIRGVRIRVLRENIPFVKLKMKDEREVLLNYEILNSQSLLNVSLIVISFFESSLPKVIPVIYSFHFAFHGYLFATESRAGLPAKVTIPSVSSWFSKSGVNAIQKPGFWDEVQPRLALMFALSVSITPFTLEKIAETTNEDFLSKRSS